MAIGLLHDPRFTEHDTGPQHPERPARLGAIGDRLTSTGLLDRLRPVEAVPADMGWVRRVHEQGYVDRLADACRAGAPFIDGPDSAIGPESCRIARLAVGGVLAAVDAVMSGRARRAFCAVRPPGHHAEHDRSMGFCLYNNVAIAAEYLLAGHGLQRVAVVDFDVHHGNGTQHTFERRADVLFVSLHEDPRWLYPGTGFAEEVGAGAGRGFTVNIPMAPGSGDAAYRRAFTETVLPRLATFAPEALLVSAGFDAAAADPLAHIELSAEAFAWMTARLCEAADGMCQGRLLSTLEGGYDLGSLADGVEAHVRALLGD